MSNLLPKIIDPAQLANENAHLSGALDFAEMSRLQPLLASPNGKVMADIDFGIDYDGTIYIRGKLQSQLRLLCQRCLKEMDYPLEAEFVLAPISNEHQAQDISDAYEVLLTQGEPVSMSQLLEDELLINMPFSAMHLTNDCDIEVAEFKEINHLAEESK